MKGQKVPMATKPRGEGLKALVAGPPKKEFLRLPLLCEHKMEVINMNDKSKCLKKMFISEIFIDSAGYPANPIIVATLIDNVTKF